MTKWLKNLIDKKWQILIVCFLGLTPLIWFKDGLIIAGGDNFFYLDPSSNFIDNLSAWLGRINAGTPNMTIPLIFPFMFFWVVLKEIGLSLVNVERLWAIFLFVTPGLSMYYLVTHLTNGKENNNLAGLTAAVLYMFNMFVMIDVLQLSKLVQATLPILLYFWISGLNDTKSYFKYSVLISLISIMYSSININLAYTAVIFITMGVYLIFFIITQKQRPIHTLKFVLVTAVLYLLVNFWWVITSFIFMVQVSSVAQQAVKGIDFTGSAQLSEAFRFMGFWAFQTILLDYGKPLVPYAHFYYEPFLIILTYLIPVSVFLALILKPKNKHVIFFGILALIGLFLVKGVNEPFGFIYKFLYTNIPGFWIFREPFTKFTTLNTLSFSVLLGFSIQAIYDKITNSAHLRKKRFLLFLPKLIPLLIITIILTNSYPLITGEVIQDNSWYNDPKVSLHVDVPDYWHEAGDWLEKSDKDARIFLLPKAGYGHRYNWKSGMATGGSVAQVFLPNPLIEYPNAFISDNAILIGNVYSIINPNLNQNLFPFFSLFNVKYILQQNDIDWKHQQTYSPQEIKEFLANQPGITFERSFGMLDLYRVNDTYFLPHIYAPKEITYFSGGIDELPFMFSFYDYELKNGIFFSNNLNIEQEALILNNANNIFANFIPNNFSRNEIEYTLQIPKTSNYELYIKRPNNLDNLSLWLDGENFGVRKPTEKQENSYEYKLNHELIDLMVCNECENNVKISSRFFLPKNILPYDASLGDGVYVDGKLIPNLSWKAGDDSIEVGFKTVKKVVSLNVPNDWKFLAEMDNADLYETYLPVSFPESHDTSFYKRRSLIVFRDNVSLKKEYEKPLSEIDSVVIGQIKPRRMVVSIPKEKKTFDEKQATRQLKGIYRVVYAEEENSLPPPAVYTIKYRKDSGYVFLGDLSLEKGEHKLKLQFSDIGGSVKSLKIPNDWKLIHDDGKVALYESFLPSSFPDSLDTSLSKKKFINVYRDNVLLKVEYEKPLTEPDAVVIGQIPRRVAVSVTTGTKPTGDYNVVYIEGNYEQGKSNEIGNLFIRIKGMQVAQPGINFEKINAAEYEVSVINATDPYFLIFSESYHPKWKLYIQDNKIPDSEHFLVNGYANAWYINKTGNYKIKIWYEPQSYFNIGLIISGITFIGCLGYLIYKQKSTKSKY